KIRYGEQLKMTIDIKGDFRNKTIAPLLLIPFVENSFKHGTSKMIASPWIELTIRVENNCLYFSIINSRPKSGDLSSLRGNIGLKNVTKRLQLLYPGAHQVDVEGKGESFSIGLRIDLDKVLATFQDIQEPKSIAQYEMA